LLTNPVVPTSSTRLPCNSRVMYWDI